MKKENNKKATELRIGNLMIDKKFPTIISEIQMIKSNGVLMGSYDDGQNIEDFEPITLTEEWLIKFRFSKTDGYGYKLFGNWLQKEDGTYWYNVNGNFIELLYVHELQNLYFSLMGRELKK